MSLRKSAMRSMAVKHPIDSKTGDGYEDAYQPLLGSLQPLSGSLVAQMYGERLRNMRLLLAAPAAPVNEGDGVCVDVPGEESPDFKVVYVARWSRHLVVHLEYIPEGERVRRDAD